MHAKSGNVSQPDTCILKKKKKKKKKKRVKSSKNFKQGIGFLCPVNLRAKYYGIQFKKIVLHIQI